MLHKIKSTYWQLRKFVAISRQKGNSTFSAIFLLLPKAIFAKGYSKIARIINNSNLVSSINARRLKNFHSKHHHELGGHFYMIVMPGALHFLIPCLKLIPTDLKVFLVFNGAIKWEKEYLLNEFPQFDGVSLLTLPNSSISHGNAINVFFNGNTQNFGILDHDLYIFDKEIFKRLHFKDNQCMLAVFQGESQSTNFVYPHTYFLYFNTSLLKQIMDRYKVDARTYRKIPPTMTDKLASIGIRQGVFLKEYHNFFDTLHLMLALCFAEGLEVGYLEVDDKNGIYHVGGTSMGTHITKDLSRSYIALRFLEHIDSTILNKKYAHLFSKQGDASQIRLMIPKTEENSHLLFVLDQIMEKLESYKD